MDAQTQEISDQLTTVQDTLDEIQAFLARVPTAPAGLGVNAGLIHVRNVYVFNAGTTGSVAAHNVFVITGRVFVDLITAFCTLTLTSGGTPAITLGTTSAVTGFLTAPTGGAPGIVTNDWWLTAVSPQLVGGPVSVVTGGTIVSSRYKVLAENIVLDIPVSTVTGGVLIFDCWYLPITDDGKLVAAVS